MKKLSVNLIAARNLKNRPKQYISTVVCILLAMIFSSGILFFLSSLSATQEEAFYRKNGKYDIFMHVTEENISTNLQNENYIESYGLARILAQVTVENEDFTFAAATLDESAKELAYHVFLQGRYPQAENEIAMEQNTLISLGYDESCLGKEITVKFRPQNGTETLDREVEKTFTLVGIAQDKLSARFTSLGADDEYRNRHRFFEPSVFLFDGARIEAGGKELTMAYIATAIPSYSEEFSDWTDTVDNFGEVFYSTGNSDYRGFDYNFSVSNAAQSFNFAAAMSGILLVAACIAIVNTFVSQLNDRKKQIGMLRTVGATKKQIINIFGRETFIICLVCTPVSVAISYFAVRLILPKIYEEAIVQLEIPVLIYCSLFGVAVVMAAAMLPLISAAKISPVQTIRNISINRKMKKKKIKSQRKFETSSLLAKRGLTFSAGRRAIVSVLVVITIVISGLGFAFVEAYVGSAPNREHGDYRVRGDFCIWDSYHNGNYKTTGYTENDRNQILSSPYVERVNAMAKNISAVIDWPEKNEYLEAVNYENKYRIDSENATRENGEVIIEEYRNTEIYEEGFDIENPYAGRVCPIDGNSAKIIAESYAAQSDFDINSFMSGDKVILVVPKTIYVNIIRNIREDYYYLTTSYGTFSQFSRQHETTELVSADCSLNVGDEFDLSIFEETEDAGDPIKSADELVRKVQKKVKIGAIVFIDESNATRFAQDTNFSFSGQEINILTNVNAFKSQGYEMFYTNLYVYLNRDCNAEIEENMQALLQEVTLNKMNGASGIHSAWSSYQDEMQQGKNIRICMIGVIILFLAISASIITNSLGAKIRNGKREIGTLRAVGADTATITKIYIRQLLSIFGVSYSVGFGIIGLVYLAIFIYEKIKKAALGMPFEIWQTLVACAILFAVCSINLWLKIRKEAKNSIIENIREIE